MRYRQRIVVFKSLDSANIMGKGKNMKRTILAFFLGAVLLVTACKPPANPREAAWQRMVESTKNSTVEFYTWSKDKNMRDWFTKSVRSKLKEKYSINLKLSDADFEHVVEQLEADKLANNRIGKIDLLWLNEAQFVEMKNKELLYGHFTEDIHDYAAYYSVEDLAANYIGNTPTEGYLVPFNQKTLTYYYNRDNIDEAPQSLEQLKQVLSEKPTIFTYPQPQDPVGGAFVRSVILNYVDVEAFYKKDLSEAELDQLIEPGLSYLRDIAKDLVNEGKVYPATVEELDELFSNNEVAITMSLDYQHGSKMTSKGKFPFGTRPVILSDANVYQRHYLAIPFNASNKSAAIIAINDLIGKKMQINKMRNAAYGGLPPYSIGLISDELRDNLDRALHKKSIAKITSLLDSGVNDIPPQYHDYINAAWQQTVQLNTE